MKNSHRLILTGRFENGTVAKQIKNNTVSELQNMKTNLIEADCRMIFMAYHMHKEFIDANTEGTIIFYSTDTDVLVLACHHTANFMKARVFWETGTSTKYANTHRFVPVHEIVKHQGENMMRILPHIHALSGCDSTSALFHIGKKTAYKIVASHGSEKFLNLSLLAEDDTTAAINASRTLISLWYDSIQKYESLHDDLNLLRTKIASSKDTPLSRLPQCEEVFMQHVLRVMWQVRLWINACTPNCVSGSPFEFGWHMIDNKIEPIMYNCQTAAEVIGGLSCNCKGKKRCKKQCPCYKANLTCIELCNCESNDKRCHNPHFIDLEETDTESFQE